MVFVRKVKSKNNEYWILVHAVRKGKRVVQKSKYIGKTLPPKKRLEQLKKDFLKELSSGRKYKFLSEEDVRKIDEKREEYKKETARLSHLEKEERLKEFIIRFTYDSTKLSGLNVTLRQTSLILKEGVIPKGFKNLRTVKELENHERGAIAVTKYKGKLDTGFMKKIHRILFTGVEDSIAGKLRSELKRNVKIAGTPYVPPKWEDVEPELKRFFRWHDSEKRKLHTLVLAALVHLKIISIQPFADGNSRLSRLLMNWILWKRNYPLVDIPAEDLENYYDAMDEYQTGKREKPFIDYIKKRYFMETG
ncbi:MAG: Fic family protein [Candidatus Aenigmarchaeota archaeon]|nr:Fic family protein [Candidatus Aenigmarchaeota archaeon]